MKSLSRRIFLQAAGISLSMPIIKTSKAIAKSVDGPMILCSRGEYWGPKVLQPGWDILSVSDNLLDAVEASANVTELDPEDQSVGYVGLPAAKRAVAVGGLIPSGAPPE